MRAEVLKYLSPGMPIENARRIMEDSGFKCEDSWDQTPSCLWCSATYAPATLFSWCADIIYVDIHHESGKVTDVTVDCDCLGP